MHANMVIKLIPGQTVAVDGSNFSGRTDLLREFTGLEDLEKTKLDLGILDGQPSTYIGPEVYNSISGLASTVREELRLHAGCAPERSAISGLIEDLGLKLMYERNPFTLSGGEQACLTITSALALKPAALGIDCALEQIDTVLKDRILDYLRTDLHPKTLTLLADNQLEDCGIFSSVLKMSEDYSPKTPSFPLRFDPINADSVLPIEPTKPCRLSLNSVSFRYAGSSSVLRNASLQIEPGKLYLLEGRNGAGKSTLSKLLCGVLRQDSGQIFADQRQIQPWKQPGQIVAYHFQNPDLQLFSTSVEEEIKAGLQAARVNKNEGVRRGDAVMSAFGLSHLRKEHPLDLPFVIRKRVALAATIAMGCPWLILDEPTLGQDKSSSEAIAKIITDLLAVGTGIMIISHSLRFKQSLPAKLLLLEDGLIKQ